MHQICTNTSLQRRKAWENIKQRKVASLAEMGTGDTLYGPAAVKTPTIPDGPVEWGLASENIAGFGDIFPMCHIHFPN